MRKPTILKTASTLVLAGGLFLIPASADHPRDGVGRAVDQVERTTDALFNDYKRELKHRGLWKPRGPYSTLYSATFRMEDYGDSLKEYYKRGASLSSLARVAAKIDHQAHIAEDVARHLRVSGRIHAGLRQVSAASHNLTRLCQAGERAYPDPRYRSDDRFDRGYGRYEESPGRRYDRRDRGRRGRDARYGRFR